VAEIDLSALMQQAQALQARMKEMQETASSKTVEAQSGGGMVRVVVDGTMRVRKIEIDAAIVAANDKSMLEDLILVAINDGMARAQKMLADEMGKLAPLNGLQIPGFGNDGFGNE
jgi:DNA-binding YbaB/EbfC family protein